MPTKRVLLLFALAAAPPNAAASEAAASESVDGVEQHLTLRHLLSGHSPEDAVTWQFAKGLFADTPEQAAAATWSTITVPSNWELEPAPSPSGAPSSQGTYSYGRGIDRKDENRKQQLADTGTYRHQFEVPERLLGADRRFLLRFDGVMTDARVFLNGHHLRTTQGQEEHRGGFVPFTYEVTSSLLLKESNELIVAVREESSNASVNRAERDADYWLFGGIFRPVTLLSVPAQFIDTVAVDAKADGRLRVKATLRPVAHRTTHREAPTLMQLSLEDPRSGRVLAETSADVAEGAAHFDLMVPNVLPWSAHSPTLYRLELSLLQPSKRTLQHKTNLAIGFRTLEVRVASSTEFTQHPDRAGLFVNGERTILRGINRHSFWPENGRALSPERNRKDVELIKALGFNAVRSSHYPPDQAFLDACDELGLYVIDELPGWHDAYDTRVGIPILRAMLKRDRNHPSILLWANGNEGGWNKALEPLFSQLDLQQRPVLRPDSLHADFDTRHYPSWQELEVLLDPDTARNRFLRPLQAPPLLLITEMLHGLYDGGGAASLEQYWERLSSSPRFAGGFLWALLDEGVVRIDQAPTVGTSGSLHHPIDTAGNYAPDGILGPHREPSASSRGIKQIFHQPRFQVPPEAEATPYAAVVASPITPQPDLSGPSIEPVAGTLEMTQLGQLATGTTGTVTLTHRGTPEMAVTVSRGDREAPGIVALRVQGQTLPLRGGRWRVSTMKDSQQPTLVGERFEQRSGPAPNKYADRNATPETTVVGEHRAWSLTNGEQPTSAFVRYTQTFENPDHSIRWTLDQGGLRVAVLFHLTAEHDWAGLQFDLSPKAVESFVWQGLGPDRVWRNRMTGTPGTWHAELPSEEAQASVKSLGTGRNFANVQFGGIYQATESHLFLRTVEGPSLSLSLGKGTIGLLQPAFPLDAGFATAPIVPGLTYYLRPPAIGTKFHPGRDLLPLPQTSNDVLYLSFALR